VIEDVDERYKALLALRIAKVELEMVVDERTVALAQRDVLLCEVYHRVKNNLQVVDGLLVMEARQLADPAAKSALLGLRSRVHALGLVHCDARGPLRCVRRKAGLLVKVRADPSILHSRVVEAIATVLRLPPLRP
jgi:hypothetical protein